MYRWAQVSTAAACLALAFGCDGEQTEVQRQTRDLQEAQKNISKVTQELESELAKSKADVVRLEQKVAMARQGMTDDVLENQKELQEALKEQEQKVQSELGEAKREAQIHNRDTEAALKQLGQASVPAAPVEGEAVAPPVEGTVPPVTPTDMPTREDMVPVRGGPDTQPEGTVDIDRGVTPAPTPGQPVDTTGAVPPPPPAVPPATSTTTTTTKSTTTVPSDTVPSDMPTEASPPSTPPPSDMPPPPAPPAQ
jgi:hypothetical protein